MSNPTRPPGLVQRYREELQARHYARRTVATYEQWLRRFLRFHDLRHPRELGSAEVNAFLTHLAVKLRVSASTQNQALSALLFLYRELLESDLDLEGLIRARTRPKLPVVMTVEEVRAVLARLDGVEALRCGYGYMTLIFSVRRSLFAMARAGRIGARCCLRKWQRSSSSIWRRCEVCIARTLLRAMGGCCFRTP